VDALIRADPALLREDLNEEAKAEAARQFRASLEGRNFDAAQAAAAHIPEDLTVRGTGGSLPMPLLRQGRARPRQR
jgi:hypothetical protein